MPEFTRARANQVAAGIRPTITVPSVRVPGERRVALRGKPAAAMLRTLAAVHVASRTGGRPAPLGRGAVHIDPRVLANPPRVGQINVGRINVGLRVPSAPIRIGGVKPIKDEAMITSAILGQFAVENDAGRTRMAKAIVAQVAGAHERYGMDGLLLTSLIHLERVGDPGRNEALRAWRESIVSAGSPERGGSGVVIDSGAGTIGSVPGSLFSDPFKDGLARPAVVNHMASLRGGDVMIGNFALAAGIILAGAAKGAYAGYKTGGAEGALRGGFEGAGTAAFGLAKEIGGVIGAVFDIIVGWVTAENEDAKSAQQEAKDVGKDNSGPSAKDIDNKPQKDAPEPPTDESDPVGPDPDEAPPPSSEYPAPDDDGGNPWSVIGYGPMVSVGDVKAMLAKNPAGVIALSRLPGLEAVRTGFAASQSVLAQAHALTNASTKLDTTRIAALDVSSRTFDTALSVIAPKAVATKARL